MKKTIINALKGVAIGDAFGVGIEFKSRPWIKEYIHFDKFVNEWKGGNNNISPGTYSDDTEHTIGVVNALLSYEPFTEDLILRCFKDEYEEDKKAKGFPRDGHGSIENWYTGKKTIEEIRHEQASREDPGNAPVMRAVPLAFIPFRDLRAYATINADATHPNEAGRNASYLTALAGWHLLVAGATSASLIPFLYSRIDNQEVRKSLREIDSLPLPQELSEADYGVLHGVQPLPYIKWDKNIYGLPCAAMKTALNVVYVLKHSTCAFDALKYSIAMGGDIDSLAAVCTGIAGGAYGLDTLPDFLLEQTEGLDRIEILGEQLHQKFFTV